MSNWKSPDITPDHTKDVVVLINCTKNPDVSQVEKGFFQEKWFIYGFRGCWKVIGWKEIDNDGQFDNSLEDTIRL